MSDGMPGGDEGFYRLASTPFQVTPYQVAAALHDVCPLRGCAKSGRPWEHCGRAVHLLETARSLLERSSTQQVVPRLAHEAHVDEPHVQPVRTEGQIPSFPDVTSI
jgi:hypothetical protein